MSRIGKLPIAIPAGITVEINGQVVTVKGAKETLTQEFSKNITVKVENNEEYRLFSLYFLLVWS